MVKRRSRLASTIQVSQLPTTMPSPVHNSISPCWNARAGNTNMVQPLAADEPALNAEVMRPTRRPPST